jgi:phosphate transport system permease protein
MRMATRKMLDRSFTLAGVLAIAIMTASLLVILAPIFTKGMSAYVFKGTVEHRRMLLEKFGRGDRIEVVAEIEASTGAKKPVYDMISAFEVEVEKADAPVRRKLKTAYKDLKKQITMLLGPMPSEPRPLLVRNQYGQMRWHRAEDKLHAVLFVETWDYSDASGMGKQVMVPRVNDFRGTALEPMFAYLEANIDKIMQPRLTFYWGFLTDPSFDSHFIGGIWPEVIGTIYLTLGAMLFAIPMGLIAAIYLTEYAKDTYVVRLLRTCISTLAGVPSIVFGLFGLAFFINTLKVSESKSVLAGSMTLALLILPTLIRASEEAIKSVPHTFKEAALSLERYPAGCASGHSNGDSPQHGQGGW